MKTIVSKTWDFRTYKIQGKCKCSKCGKTINKTFSFELREDVSPTKEDWDELEVRKAKWLAESHVCNSCKREKIKQERQDITSDFTKDFTSLDNMQNSIREIRLDKKKILDSLRDKLKNKVLLSPDGEWVIVSISDGWQNDTALELTCHKINKQKPWLWADETRYFYFGDIDFHYDNYKPLCNCTITNEDFTKRKDML